MRRIAAESGQTRARGGDGRSQRELHSVQLPGHQNAGVKIGHHADGLQVVGEGVEFGWNVKTGHGAHLRIAQRSGHLPQIIRPHAHVAIADDHHFVRGFAHQASQLGDFVVGRDTAGTVQDANAALRKIALAACSITAAPLRRPDRRRKRFRTRDNPGGRNWRGFRRRPDRARESASEC